jgi:holo-[acyl-carrier protein] synthase
MSTMLDFTDENFGIGVDIEEISRFRKSDAGKDSPFLNKIFTRKELDYCFSNRMPAQHLAARFAAKEAIVKALSSLGGANLSYKEIEIINDDRGIPGALIRKEGFADVGIRLSLSHSRSTAVAFAIVIRRVIKQD